MPTITHRAATLLFDETDETGNLDELSQRIRERQEETDVTVVMEVVEKPFVR